MKIAFFNTKDYDRQFFNEANKDFQHDIHYLSPHLNSESTALIQDENVVCAFINDCLDAEVLHALKRKGIALVALRSAGYNHVDIDAANDLDLPVVRVPAYSPHAVAEHAASLLLTLNRKTHRAFNRVREGDFSLHGLLGYDLHGKTVGVVGTGNIGRAFIHIMRGFGCRVLAYDVRPDPQLLADGLEYVSLKDLFARSEILSLHCPLTPTTEHLINTDSLALMRDGVTLINTSRGKLIDTKDVIQALKTGKIGLLGLDVYEEEEEYFYEDLSSTVIQDDLLSRLLTFPNVIITSHQAFFTREALTQIAHTTLDNIRVYEQEGRVQNGVNA